MKTRQLEIRSRRNIWTELLWRFKSAFIWHGIEFRDFREYIPWDDVKHIDWVASSKEQTLIARRHEEDRDSILQLIIDECESLYYEEDYPKNILKNKLIRIIWTAATSSRMRIKWWRLYEDKRELCYNKNPQVNLKQISLDSKNKLRKNTSLNLRDFIIQKHKKSICIIISDSLEVDEWSLKALAILHDVIYLHISSQFENSLSSWWIQNTKWEKHMSIDLNNEKLRNQYIHERQKKLQAFRKKLLWYKVRIWMFESGQDPIPELMRTLDTHF